MVVGSSAGVPAVVSGAGAVAAVRLGRRTAHRRAQDVVLRLAGLVPLPGCDPGLGPHPADAAGLPGRDATRDRRRTDVCPGRTVAWFGIDELGALVRRHRADDSIRQGHQADPRVDIIVDDIGMLPVGEDAAEGFYRLVDACSETRSLAVPSNLRPAGFDEIMPKTLATATVDRLLHHAHICVTDGQSFRLTQATTGRGVTPLPT